MSTQALAYVQGLRIEDETTRQVFLLLAEHTKQSSWAEDPPLVLGLELRDRDIPAHAARLDITPQEFRRQLRLLKATIPMDVLEHQAEGVWEIVYGPSYTNPAPPRPDRRVAEPGAPAGPIEVFSMPGWDDCSTWGWETGLGHLYAQIIHNNDDPDAEPRIWITPPRYVLRTVDELAAAIAEAIAPYYVKVPPPAAVIKMWLTK
ncbi:hypothetical protein [Kitasatospora sp. P5_F3]